MASRKKKRNKALQSKRSTRRTKTRATRRRAGQTKARASRKPKAARRAAKLRSLAAKKGAATRKRNAAAKKRAGVARANKAAATKKRAKKLKAREVIAKTAPAQLATPAGPAPSTMPAEYRVRDGGALPSSNANAHKQGAPTWREGPRLFMTPEAFLGYLEGRPGVRNVLSVYPLIPGAERREKTPERRAELAARVAALPMIQDRLLEAMAEAEANGEELSEDDEADIQREEFADWLDVLDYFDDGAFADMEIDAYEEAGP